MGTWESNQNALKEYANNIRSGIPSNYKNISNVALGSLINAAYQKQAQEEAEKKRQLEVQKQKDADAALERKLKLQEMQFKIDSLNDAREQAKLVNTLAPWQPSSGFDSETGESITRANIPLDPILQATSIAGGLNMVGPNYDESKASNIEPTNMMKKVFEDSFKAMSAESQDPEKYKAMSEKERQKAIDNVLAPYEVSYKFRNKPIDIYKKEKDYENRELIREMINQQQTYNANVGLQKAQEGYENKLRIEDKKGENQINKQNIINQGKKDVETEKTNRALMLKAIKEGKIKPRISNGKIAGYEVVADYKPSLTSNERKEYEFYEKEWMKRFKELEISNENLDFDQLVDLTTKQMATIMKTLDKNKLVLFGNVVQKEVKNLKTFDDYVTGSDDSNETIDNILNDFTIPSLDNPKGIQQILYSESGLK